MKCLKYSKLAQELIERIDTEALREDVRKLGIALMIAGILGSLIGGDKVTFFEGAGAFTLGLFAWAAALIKEGDDDE